MSKLKKYFFVSRCSDFPVKQFDRSTDARRHPVTVCATFSPLTSNSSLVYDDSRSCGEVGKAFVVLAKREQRKYVKIF